MDTVTSAGLLHEPGATAHSRADLFHPPSDLTPADQSIYYNLCGKVTFISLLRADILKEATHLAKVKASPTASDMAKLVIVIRYLHYTAYLGPTYYTEEGVIMYAYCDVAFAVHHNSRSQTGYHLCIGKDSAPS
jgi:hypothetical protein